MRKVCIIGCFADTLDLLNGQTVKTKIVYKELEKSLGCDEVIKIDTYGGMKTLVKTPIIVLNALKNAENIIILPAENGLRIIAPLLIGFNSVFKRNIYYDVIGGWLPEFVKKRKWLGIFLKKINSIFVETSSMKEQLESQGYNNIDVIPNCKELVILDAKTIKYTDTKPYRLCTFSRVTKEKGIEDAVQAVCEINSMHNDVFAELDVYGQIEDNQKEWFEKLQTLAPQYIRYKGMVPFTQSTKVLKEYDALLFPTYYEGEGFAGTIIDAFAAGLPVIASDWKYNSEIIKSGMTGVIFKTHSISELKAAIMSIDSDIKKWNLMRQNCVSEAKRYLPANAMKKLIDIVNG